MDSEVLERLQKFHMLEDIVGIQLKEEDISSSHDAYCKSLVGKILGEKMANFIGRNTLQTI